MAFTHSRCIKNSYFFSCIQMRYCFVSLCFTWKKQCMPVPKTSIIYGGTLPRDGSRVYIPKCDSSSHLFLFLSQRKSTTYRKLKCKRRLVGRKMICPQLEGRAEEQLIAYASLIQLAVVWKKEKKQKKSWSPDVSKCISILPSASLQNLNSMDR